MTDGRGLRSGIWIGITATANVVSWQAAAMVLAAMVVSGVLRLLAEWQRRQTIKALMARVPEGTVVVLGDTPAGQSMRASLGPGPSRRPNAGS
jgi:cation transport ATPase